MKKKMFTILLSVLLVLSVFMPPVGAQASGFEPDARRVINFVKTFSLMNELTVEDMQNKTPLTRAQFAVIISRIAAGGEDRIADGEVPFSDVPQWARPYVYFAYSQGIMVGDGKGRFMPDASVTYGQAAKVFVHLLGYDAQVLKRGGYMTEYIQQASRLGLLDGMDINAQGVISRYDVARLLYQAVGVEVQNIRSISNTHTEVVKDGRDYLAVYLGITSDEGVLGAINGKSAVKNVQSVKGKATLDNKVVSVTDARYDALLGCYVRYYLKNTGNEEYELVYLEEHKKNTVTRVKNRDVLKNDPEFSMTNFIYNENGGEKETIKITGRFCYVYNGMYDFDFDWDVYAFDSGYVDLIDHQDDGIIDVVMVWNFDEIVVDKVSGEVIVGTHYDKFDASLYGNDITMTFPDGSTGSVERMSELKMWDVVSIAKCSNGEIVSLVVCRDGITGLIEERVAEERIAYVIDGKKYYLSGKFENDIDKKFAKEPKVGQSGEFYFNVVGEIAGIREKKSSTELQYGFLLRLAKPSGISTQVKMRLIESSGKETEMLSENKIYFTNKNGVREKVNAVDSLLGADLCPAGTIEPQLIRYRTNKEGKVTEVECAVAGNAVMHDSDHFSADYTAGDEPFYFNDHASGFCSALEDGTILYPEFFAGSTTTIFYIPMQNGSVIEDEAKIVSVNYFVNQEQYKNLIFYDNNETMVPSVIVYQPNVAEVSATFKESDNLVLVDKIVSAVNTKGDIVNMLKCYTGGSYQRLEMQNDSNIKLSFGDILYAKYNADGILYVDASSIIFKNDGSYPLYYKINHSTANPFSICWSTNGIIYRKTQNHISVYCGNDGYMSVSLGQNKPLVYIVSTNGKVRIGSADDLVSSSAVLQPNGDVVGNLDGSKVFLNTRIDYVREIFIFED